jgi:hypothetical protein
MEKKLFPKWMASKMKPRAMVVLLWQQLMDNKPQCGH